MEQDSKAVYEKQLFQKQKKKKNKNQKKKTIFVFKYSRKKHIMHLNSKTSFYSKYNIDIKSTEDFELFVFSLKEYQRDNNIKRQCVIISFIYNYINNRFNIDNHIRLTSGVMIATNMEQETYTVVSHMWNELTDGLTNEIIEKTTEWNDNYDDKDYYEWCDFLLLLKVNPDLKQNMGNEILREKLNNEILYQEAIKEFKSFTYNTYDSIDGHSFDSLFNGIREKYNELKSRV